MPLLDLPFRVTGFYPIAFPLYPVISAQSQNRWIIILFPCLPLHNLFRASLFSFQFVLIFYTSYVSFYLELY